MVVALHERGVVAPQVSAGEPVRAEEGDGPLLVKKMDVGSGQDGRQGGSGTTVSAADSIADPAISQLN